MTTVLEQKVREAADAIVDTFKQFNARLSRAERGLEELRAMREQLQATKAAVEHVMGQLKLTYEALDHVINAMKVDEDKHEQGNQASADGTAP